MFCMFVHCLHCLFSFVILRRSQTVWSVSIKIHWLLKGNLISWYSKCIVYIILKAIINKLHAFVLLRFSSNWMCYLHATICHEWWVVKFTRCKIYPMKFKMHTISILWIFKFFSSELVKLRIINWFTITPSYN